MVFALQPVTSDVGQDVSHDTAQRVLDEEVVTDQVGHRNPPATNAKRRPIVPWR